jgi:hypothetical protein
VTKRAALSSAVADLPSSVDELKSLVKSVLPSDGRQVELRRGEVAIYVNRGADVERFVAQLARRYRAIEQILEQAERVGSEIKRLRTTTISTRLQKLVFLALFRMVTRFLLMEN